MSPPSSFTPAPASVRSVPKKQEHQVTTAPTPVPVSETVVSNTNARENGNLEAEGLQFIILLFDLLSVSYFVRLHSMIVL